MSEQPRASIGADQAPATNGDDRKWWRTVLGEYPTGVTLITSLDADGNPIGMVVGTFAAVSENPPLISFTPASDSSTFPQVAAHGRFVASVLGGGHEQLCRAFSRKLPDKFDTGTWIETEGIPRLADAVAWFDGTIEVTHTAGDHQIVVASVNDFGVGDANSGLPLLYLRGGYGSFTVPSLQFNVQGLTRQLKHLDLISARAQAFAEEHRIEAVICGLAGDTIVVLRALNMQGDADSPTRQIGASFPFAAPLAPGFAAWGTPETRTTWIENSRHLLGSVDRGSLQTLLDDSRERGFVVTRGKAVIDDFGRVMTNPDSSRKDFAALWDAIADENEPVGHIGIPDDASSIQLPIIGPSGIAELELAIAGFENAIAMHGAQGFRDRLVALSAELAACLAEHETSATRSA